MKTKKIIKTEVLKYPELPEIVFQKSDDGIIYFNATHYLKQKGKFSTEMVESFVKNAEVFIQSICKVYNLSNEEMIVKDEITGDMFMEETLAILLVTFIDADFAVYVMERVAELLQTGMAFSDTTIALMVRSRFTKEDVENLYEAM